MRVKHDWFANFLKLYKSTVKSFQFGAKPLRHSALR
jgi:hypothetical protein